MPRNKDLVRPPEEIDSTNAALATYLLEDSDDRKVMRVSLWAAVGVHLLILLINFPSFTRDLSAHEKKEKKVFVVQHVKFRPPPISPPKVPQQRAKRVPIPDPTPDEIEPLRIDDPVPEMEMEMDTELDFAIPDTPPAFAEEPSGPIQIGGNVKRPVKVHTPQPRYTELARRARIQGTVIVEAIVDKQGDVTQVKILRGLSMGLSEEAVKAVKSWKFKAATLNGKPVDVFYNLTVHFKLQ